MFEEKWANIEVKYNADYWVAMDYLCNDLLNILKEKVLKCLTNKLCYFGNITTSRAEGVHAKIKQHLNWYDKMFVSLRNKLIQIQVIWKMLLMLLSWFSLINGMISWFSRRKKRLDSQSFVRISSILRLLSNHPSCNSRNTQIIQMNKDCIRKIGTTTCLHYFISRDFTYMR